MSERYKVRDQEENYFITLTILQWIDLFTRDRYVHIVEESLNYCIEEKGLVVFAYVIMPSHIHMIVGSKGMLLNDIVRDFKKHTSKTFIEAISEAGESRTQWLLNTFSFHAQRSRRHSKYRVWKDGFHPKIMDRMEKLEATFNYIHYNPVAAGYVRNEQDWIHSSASAYMDDGSCPINLTKWY
ncbi:transposase [Nonlabens spongiae]|uniref:Transposase n=1 Tax=Nonlabens spongiae TaxID=331648 RepID=A0A1W6MP81_9FLAO|nr:transposase [Nonlabens spongiae]ARN79269.1 transposase [Nonlabens spongiae]